MLLKYRSQTPSLDVPEEPRRPLITSVAADSRLFPGWGPRI
jgi:hypothetical protein